jgi:hypothetical protein
VLSPTAPVSGNDYYIIAPPAVTRLPVLSNDGIVNGAIDKTTVTLVTAPTLGTATVDTATGEIVYSPQATVGHDTFTYTVKSRSGEVSNLGRVDVVIGGADGMAPTDPPTVVLNADPMSILSTQSQPVTLQWSTSANATGCTATGAWSGTKDLSGTESIATLTQTSTFMLTCDALGGSTTQAVTVTVTSGGAPPGSGDGSGGGSGTGGSGTGSTSSSGHGGGGSIELWDALGLLLALLVMQRQASREDNTRCRNVSLARSRANRAPRHQPYL